MIFVGYIDIGNQLSIVLMPERETVQQRLVRQTFEAAQRPLKAEDALRIAKKQRPSLGLATVYRTIRTLMSRQTLCAVEVPGESTHYEINHGHHHHHFHCRRCRQVFEVEQCPVKPAALGIPGFTVERHEITLFGLCNACGQKETHREHN